jgi:hypothetical protein
MEGYPVPREESETLDHDKISEYTEPPFDSFRRVSQTVVANLVSPKTVANSARRRDCEGGTGPPLAAGVDTERIGPEDEGNTGVGVGEGDGVPNNLRVEENRRDGSLRVDEN